MSYRGQPVPSTVYNAARAKISDGKSVRVAVPENMAVFASKFYYLGGFLGAAMQSVTTGAGETAEVVLNIEPAEYETDQVKDADRASMTAGTDIYWDNDGAAMYFTVSATAIYAGRITAAADAHNVIWFKLAERPHSLDSVAVLSGQVGNIAALNTSVKTSVVAAVNSLVVDVGAVDARIAVAVDPVDDVSSLSVTDATDLKTVATQLNALIGALKTVGLMTDGS